MTVEPLRTRELGTSGIKITTVGLGCWQFSGGKGIIGGYWGRVDPAEIRKIVETSIAGGINWFDTAEAYGFGRSERALSDALQELSVEPGTVVVATKWLPFLRTAGSISRTFPTRRDALAPFGVDLHQIHAPASLAGIRAQMSAMADLLDEGEIRAVGVSNFSADQMRRADDALRARGHRLSANQVRFSLLDRDIEKNGVLDAARERGITIIAYSPLAQGLLTGRFHENPELIRSRPGPRRFMGRFKESNLLRTEPLVNELATVAQVHAATAAQVALAAIVQGFGDTVVAIPGATKARHAEQNAEAIALELTRVELDRIWSRARDLE